MRGEYTTFPTSCETERQQERARSTRWKWRGLEETVADRNREGEQKQNAQETDTKQREKKAREPARRGARAALTEASAWGGEREQS